MADTIKTEYMGKANVGFSEYLVRKVTDLDNIPAKPGDRAIIQEEGSIYVCIEGGQWEKLNLPTGGGGGSITVDDEMSDTSENAVQNKVIKSYVDTGIANIPVDNALSDVSENPVQNKVVKSAIDSKLDLSGGTMTGNIYAKGLLGVVSLTAAANGTFNFNNNTLANVKAITGLISPIGNNSAANKKYVDDADALNEKLANKVTAISSASTDTEYPSAKCINDLLVALQGYVDTELAKKLNLSGGTMSGILNMGGKGINNVASPYGNNSAANKKYVDDSIAAALIVDTEEVIP